MRPKLPWILAAAAGAAAAVPRGPQGQQAHRRIKYPRTFHLPWSMGATFDDKTLKTPEQFYGKEVVVTEKLDGENTTIYDDGYVHARSLDSRSHESQAWVRALAARLRHDIPRGWRVCGENMFAKHSLSYDKLATYFYVFAIYDENNYCLSWDDTVQWASLMGLTTVPTLYRGPWNEVRVRACYTGKSRVGREGEGYVVRVASGFPYRAFSRSLAKFVRADHVQPDAKHWKLQRVVPNKIGK